MKKNETNATSATDEDESEVADVANDPPPPEFGPNDPLYRLRLVEGQDVDSQDLLGLFEEARRLNASRALPATKCIVRVERRGDRVKLVELASFPSTKFVPRLNDQGEPTDTPTSMFERRTDKERGGEDDRKG